MPLREELDMLLIVNNSYWGQNSYGATHSDTANYQKRLSFYCGSDSVIDTFPLAFLDIFFGPGGVPSVDFSNVRTYFII